MNQTILEILTAILMFLTAIQRGADVEKEKLTLIERVSQFLVIKEQKEVSLKPKVIAEETKAEINPETIVGLVCYFEDKSTGEIKPLTQGSGVIFDSRGYILTSRHIFDLEYEFQFGDLDEWTYRNFQFSHCLAGSAPSGTKIYTDPQIIERVRPGVEIPYLPYLTQVVFLPQKEKEFSELEYQWLDFAVLQITGLRKGAEVFGFRSLPEQFPAAELLEDFSQIKEGALLITYGMPAYYRALKRSRNLFLVGSYGWLTKIFVGDQFFKETPFVIETRMELDPGRSGSPIFWNSKVIAIAQSITKENKFISRSIAMPAILKVLREYTNFAF